jgi:hypothetical protein
MKKKGDCIAVQPLDHRTTQHDYEQKGRKNKTMSLKSLLDSVRMQSIPHEQPCSHAPLRKRIIGIGSRNLCVAHVLADFFNAKRHACTALTRCNQSRWRHSGRRLGPGPDRRCSSTRGWADSSRSRGKPLRAGAVVLDGRLCRPCRHRLCDAQPLFALASEEPVGLQ